MLTSYGKERKKKKKEIDDDCILDYRREEMVTFESDGESGMQEETRCTRSSQRALAPKKRQG